MQATLTVLQPSKLATLTPLNFFASGSCRSAMADVQERATNELVQQSPPAIGELWQPQVQALSSSFAVAYTNKHPGTVPLDQGATWRGSMPPWGPETSLGQWAEAHGIPAFLVARSLQRNGLTARHFVAKSLEAVRLPALQILMDQGVKRWVLGEG